jgi:hypothetical protein
MDVEALMRPFEGTQRKQRIGPGRKPLDYVSGPDVIRRLLDSTENRFSWKVEKTELVEQESQNGPVHYWVVQGTLSLPEMGVRSGIGTHPAESPEAPKAAETDAFKRAAVKFGVGLHLYEEEPSGQGTNAAPSGYEGNGRGSGGNGSRTYRPPASATGRGGYGNGAAARRAPAAPASDFEEGDNNPFH